MNNVLVINNLNFKYDDKVIFSNFDLEIKKATFTTILGPNGSGKSTLIKIILGLFRVNSYINISGMILNNDNLKKIREKIGVVFENPDNQFVAETVMDDIAFSLENMNYDKKEIKKRIKEVSELLGITKILEEEPHNLSGGEKQLVALASALVIKPEILILDEALSMIDPETRTKILSILVKLNKENNLTIISITHDSEEALYGSDVILLDTGKIILNGKKELVFKEEEIFKKTRICLPFMADLSIKLKYYNLLDKMIFDMDEMVDVLWK